MKYSHLAPASDAPPRRGPRRWLQALWQTAAAALSVALLAAPLAAREPPAAVADESTEASIVRLTASILARSQFAHRQLDVSLAGEFLDKYLEALDPERVLFLRSDLAEFAAYRPTLARDIQGSGSTALAHTVFERFVTRLRERSEFVSDTLRDGQFDFGGDDVYLVDRDNAEPPRDLDEARALWLGRLRVDYLQEKLQGKESAAIREKLTGRAERQARDMGQMSREQVLEVYLSSLARVYDPHSDYLGREQMQDFAISMNLSLFGIGARLRSVDGRCEVVNLVPGGPAMRSGQLGPGDRIVAVAQEGEAPVDVVEMGLRRIVAMIRGPKGTVVHLTVIPADDAGAKRRTIRLVRDEIRLEEQRAAANVIEVPLAGGTSRRLGVVSLPSFYADLGAERGERPGSGASVTDDVKVLLGKLADEDIDGIVLDLRRNSGGSLREAIRLTGLFIEKGPIVQTRGLEGRVSVARDPDPALVYGGPLVVLTSRASASASEILAGALQDYGRAVIAGDPSTFGKGTVQSVVPLGPMMKRAGLDYAYDPGALKVTIRKFYLPGGASTQLRGVRPDIVLPSISGIRPVGEAELENPLPWDAISATSFSRVAEVAPYLGQLRARSAQRIARRKDFAYLRDEVKRIEQRQEERSVSLNEKARRAELDELEARREAFRTAMKALPELAPARVITVAKAPPAPPSAPAGDADGDAEDPTESRDIVLQEALRILSDLVLLRGGGRFPAEGQAATAGTHQVN